MFILRNKDSREKRMKLNENNRGFTLVEVLVVSAIMGIMVVGLMQFMSFQQRSAKTAELQGDVAVVRNLLAGWLESKSICEATLLGLKNNDTVQIDEILRKRGATPSQNEVIMDLGFRFPGTNWRVTKMDLLSRAEAQAYNSAFNGAVDDDGVGVALIKVTIQQLRGSSNTQTVTANEDRGNYAAAEKTLYFPLRARFGEFFFSSAHNGDNNPSFFTQDLADQYCSWTADPNEANFTTMGQKLQSLEATVTEPTAQFKLYTDGQTTSSVVAPVTLITTYTHIADCLAFAANLPIVECVPPGSSSTNF